MYPVPSSFCDWRFLINFCCYSLQELCNVMDVYVETCSTKVRFQMWNTWQVRWFRDCFHFVQVMIVFLLSPRRCHSVSWYHHLCVCVCVCVWWCHAGAQRNLLFETEWWTPSSSSISKDTMHHISTHNQISCCSCCCCCCCRCGGCLINTSGSF